MKAYIFMDLKFNGCSRWLMTVILIFISLAGYAQAPVITSFSPASAKPGDAVTLTGTGFNTTTTNNIVFFGATRATVTTATATSVTATVPTGATYAPITLLNTGTVLACASLSSFHPVYSPAKAGISSSDISGKVDFNTGLSPQQVKIGDLDGDGNPDLVFANVNSNTVTVFRNTSSSGSVSYSASSYTTGTSPYDVAIGDLDGDGKPDLAVANAGSANVSMFRNTSSSGSVSFAAAINYGTGTTPTHLAIGDLDVDGKPDVAVLYGNTIYVIRNISTIGSFGMQWGGYFSVGTAPFGIAIGDLDNDGKPELVIPNNSSNNFSVLRNTSSSPTVSFATKVDFTTGSGPYGIAIGDLDGDGKSDVAVQNYTSMSVSVFRNLSSSGSVSFDTKVDYATGAVSYPYAVAIGDLDGDGKPDLATANNGSADVSVFRNNSSSGSMSFGSAVKFGTGVNPRSIAIGDLDGDSRPDLAVANYSSNTISVLRNAVCTNPTTGGTIAAAQSGSFPFDPAAFTSSVAASGHTGTLEYKWQSSTTSGSAGFSDIVGATTETYNAGALTQTTWFKRLARSTCASWTDAAESNVLEVTICVNPSSGGTIAAAQSGTTPFDPSAFTSAAAASGHSGTLEYKWQSSTTNSSAGFSDISGATSATYDAGALTQTTWFKRLARVSCQASWTGAAESNVLEVTVTPCVNPSAGGTIAAAQSGNSPFDPSAFTSAASASGNTGTLEYKWQSSTTSSSAGFSDIAGATSATYDAGALTQTTWFKRLARVSCQSSWSGAAESNVLEVTVCANPTSGGTIAAVQSGATPFNPSAFTSSAAASGHSGTLEYKWQSSTTSNSAGFSDIAGATSETYDAGALTQTTWYKRLARVSCQTDWTGAAESNVLEVTVTPCVNPTSGGTIAVAQTGATPFNPSAFTSSAAASGHSGMLEYKWQSLTTSSSVGFSDITGATSETYDAGALTQTTWYKRLARVSCQSDWTGAVESNVLEVTVTPCVNPTSGGTIAAAQSGNSPFDPAAFTSSAAASGHTGTLEYKWQSSTTSSSSSFSDITGATSATYDPGALTQTTWFKRLARVSCQSDWTGAASSNVLEVTVTICINPSSGGTIAAAQSGNSPFDPSAFTSAAAASGNTGTLEYKWQSSISSSSAGFSDIAAATSATYDAGALTQTTWFKRLARVSCQSSWSGAAESNVLEVTVCANPTSGGTIAAAQTGATPFNPAAFTSSAASSGHSGTLEYKWQSSTTNSSAGFSDITGATSETYDAGALTQTTWYKRIARVSCQSDWTGAVESNVLEVTVTPCVNPTSGPIAANQTGSNPFDPVAFTSSKPVSGHMGTLEYQWQSSTTSSTKNFSDIIGATSETYDAGALTQTTWFRRKVRVTCETTWMIGNVLRVFVGPCVNPTSGGTISAAQSGVNPFNPVAIKVTTGADGYTGTFEAKWQRSTTSSSAGFSDIPNEILGTYNPGALTQTTWYRRLARVGCQPDWTGAASSNVLEMTVANCTNPTSGGTIGAAQSGQNPYDPAGFTNVASPSGHNGNLKYQWQSSTTSSSDGFSDITGANSSTYNADRLTQTTWYRRLALGRCQSDWTTAVVSNVLEVTVSSTITEPTAQPTSLFFSHTGSGSYNAVGRFTRSAGTSGYLVVRNTGSAPTFTPVDGTEYSVGSQTGGAIVYSGSALTFTESSVTTGTTYYYAIYAYNGSGSSINYRTTSPLVGKVITASGSSVTTSASSIANSIGFPTMGVTVSFPSGNKATSLTVQNVSSVTLTRKVNAKIRKLKQGALSIKSSNAKPGRYTLVVDYSSKFPGMTTAKWNNLKLMKRGGTKPNSPWVDIIKATPGASIVSRATDGVAGKFTVRGLSSFSDFGGGEESDGVLSTNLDETVEATLEVTDVIHTAQAFTTDGLRYDLTKAKVSVSAGESDLRLRLYGSSGGNVNTANLLTEFDLPIRDAVSGTLLEFTPLTAVKLEPNTQYWLALFSDGGTIDVDYTVSLTNSGVATFPADLTATSDDAGVSFTTSSTNPVLFSIEATEVERTWTGALSTDWGTAGNWTPSETPGNGEILNIPADLSTYPVLTQNISVANLLVDSSATVSLNDKVLSVTQGVQLGGNFIATTGRLSLSGSEMQSVTGGGIVTNLEINNSAGVALDEDVYRMLNITGALTLTAGTLYTNDNMILKSSNSGTARVAPLGGTASIDGKATVERYIPAGRKWRFLATPLTGSTNNSVFYNWQNNDEPNGETGVEIWGPLGTADPDAANNGLAQGANASMRYYDGGWQNVTNTNTTNLFDATTNFGYALFQTGPYNNGSTTYIGSPGSLPAATATTLSATGSLITGDHTKNFTATSTGQYFLVGNPYASPVDPRSFTATGTVNRTNLNGKLWMWDAKPSGGLGRYVSFDLSSNAYSVPGNGYADNNVMIQSGQAFFVQAPAVGVASLVFRETSKDANGSHAMMGDEIRTVKSLLRLTLQQPVTADSTENLDGAVAVFHAEGKAGLDPLDGSKLMNSSENIFFRREARSLTFEHRPVVTAKDTLYLRMSNLQNRTYRLQVKATDFPDTDGVTAELTDRFTGKSTPISLKGVTDHAFAVTADSMSTGDRFMVVFSKAAAPVTVIPDTDGGDVFKLYPNPVREKLKVAVQLSTSGPFGLQVFDASGSEVWRRTGIAAGTKTVEVNTAGLRNGVYMLRLTDAKGETRVEKFVRE